VAGVGGAERVPAGNGYRTDDRKGSRIRALYQGLTAPSCMEETIEYTHSNDLSDMYTAKSSSSNQTISCCRRPSPGTPPRPHCGHEFRLELPRKNLKLT
jgi:hypothetical protein